MSRHLKRYVCSKWKRCMLKGWFSQITKCITHAFSDVLSLADNWEGAESRSFKNICKKIYKSSMEQIWTSTDMIKESTWFPYLFCGEQGLVRYWHIGNKRNANAIVARTEGGEQSTAVRPKGLIYLGCLFQLFFVSLMGQLMAFTVSIINGGKRSSPACNYWTEMWTPYYSNSTAVGFLC